MHSQPAHPTNAALAGVALLLPFLAANAIVGNRIEPFFSLIRPGQHTSPQEYAVLFAVLFLIAVGAFVAASGPLDYTGFTTATVDGDVATQWYAAVDAGPGQSGDKVFASCE